MAQVIVEVMPKPEILDPQGQVVSRALARLGHPEMTEVRQGKRFTLEVSDSVTDAELAEVASSLLANTVIEDWRVLRVTGGSAASGGTDVVDESVVEVARSSTE